MHIKDRTMKEIKNIKKHKTKKFSTPLHLCVQISHTIFKIAYFFYEPYIVPLLQCIWIELLFYFLPFAPEHDFAEID